MSDGVNKAILIGNVGSDPESRQATGKTVTNFRMATNESWKDKHTGERVTKTEWHRIVAWGKLGEICAQYLRKGKQIYIEGRIQTREWTDKDDNRRWTTEIEANQMRMLGSKGDKPAAVPEQEHLYQDAINTGHATAAEQGGEDSDEPLPF